MEDDKGKNNLEHIQKKILQSCLGISKSFFKVGRYLNDLMAMESNLNSEEDKLTQSHCQKPKFSRRKRLRYIAQKEKQPEELNTDIQGEVFPVVGMLGSKKVQAYSIRINYYNNKYIIGPYENSEFCNDIKTLLIQELSKLKVNPYNFNLYIQNKFDEFKIALYREYPILKLKT